MAAISNSQELHLTGVPALDAQHRHVLAELDACEAVETIDLEVFSNLQRTLAVHFAEEEALIRLAATPSGGSHCDKHRHFLVFLDELSGRCRRDGRLPVGEIHLLRTWFVIHSNTHDVEMAEELAYLDRRSQAAILGRWLEEMKTVSVGLRCAS